MSSDKLGSIQRPVLDLDLDISEGGHKRREQLELTKEELETLLSSLDAANKVCGYIWVERGSVTEVRVQKGLVLWTCMTFLKKCLPSSALGSSLTDSFCSVFFQHFHHNFKLFCINVYLSPHTRAHTHTHTHG